MCACDERADKTIMQITCVSALFTSIRVASSRVVVNPPRPRARERLLTFLPKLPRDRPAAIPSPRCTLSALSAVTYFTTSPNIVSILSRATLQYVLGSYGASERTRKSPRGSVSKVGDARWISKASIARGRVSSFFFSSLRKEANRACRWSCSRNARNIYIHL